MSKGTRLLETKQSEIICSKAWRGRMRYQESTEGEALGRRLMYGGGQFTAYQKGDKMQNGS